MNLSIFLRILSFFGNLPEWGIPVGTIGYKAVFLANHGTELGSGHGGFGGVHVKPYPKMMHGVPDFAHSPLFFSFFQSWTAVDPALVVRSSPRGELTYAIGSAC